MITPWREITGEQSPFVQIFNTLGVSWAAGLLNFVVITAALSAINADLFGAGRVITGLAHQKHAPKFMSKVVRGVPVMTTIILIATMIIGTILNALLPENVFEVIASLATFATVFVWLMILLAHLYSRRGMSTQDVANLKYKVPFWPYGQYLSIAFILMTFGIMVWQEEYRISLVVGVAFIAIMTAVYFLTNRHEVTHEDEPTEEPEELVVSA